MRIRAQNACEMQQFINENPLMAGTQMDGVTYRPQNINEGEQHPPTPQGQNAQGSTSPVA